MNLIPLVERLEVTSKRGRLEADGSANNNQELVRETEITQHEYKAYRPNDIDLVFDKPTFHIDATRPTGLLAIQRYYDVGIEASILSSESLKTWDVHELRAGKAKSGRCYYQRQAESNVMDMRYQEELNEYRKVKVEKICVNPWLSSDLARFVGRTREGRSLEALPTNSDWPFEIRPEAELETMQKSDHEQRSVVDQIEQAIEDLERKYWTYCQSVLCNPSKEKESGKQPSIANENESRQGQPSGNTSSPSGTGLEQSSLKVPKPTIIPLKGRNLRQGLGPKINRAAVRTSRTVTKANSMEPSSHGSDVLQDETSPGELPLSTTPPGDPPRPFKFQ